MHLATFLRNPTIKMHPRNSSLQKTSFVLFDHKVVTLVAYKLERQYSGYEKFTLVLNNTTREADYLTTMHNTLTTMKESLQMYFKVAGRNQCKQVIPLQTSCIRQSAAQLTTIHRHEDCLCIVVNWAAGCLMQLVCSAKYKPLITTPPSSC